MSEPQGAYHLPSTLRLPYSSEEGCSEARHWGGRGRKEETTSSLATRLWPGPEFCATLLAPRGSRKHSFSEEAYGSTLGLPWARQQA